MLKFALFFVFTLFHSISQADAFKLGFVGDSITEGYGVDTLKSYPYQLQDILIKKSAREVQIYVDGISGSTSASGPARVKAMLQKQKLDLLVIALGANDGLRGLPVASMKSNLAKSLSEAKKTKVKVLLVGMHAPPNLGKKYTQEFDKCFKSLNSQYKPLFAPFLLEGVAGNSKLNQSDQIHPNEEGHLKVAENLSKYILPVISKKKTSF